MFDYIFAENSMPWAQCPECNYKMHFHGGYYPTEVVCQNCGKVLNLKNSLQGLEYPRLKYDENGYIIKEK